MSLQAFSYDIWMYVQNVSGLVSRALSDLDQGGGGFGKKKGKETVRVKGVFTWQVDQEGKLTCKASINRHHHLDTIPLRKGGRAMNKGKNSPVHFPTNLAATSTNPPLSLPSPPCATHKSTHPSSLALPTSASLHSSSPSLCT